MIDKVFFQILNMSFASSFAIIFVLFARLILKKVPKVFSYIEMSKTQVLQNCETIY